MKPRIENLIIGFSDRAVTADSPQEAYALISQEYSDRSLHQNVRQPLSFTLLFESGHFSELELPFAEWAANFPSHEEFERRFVQTLEALDPESADLDPPEIPKLGRRNGERS